MRRLAGLAASLALPLAGALCRAGCGPRSVRPRRYTSEVFETSEQLAAAASRLLAVLGETSDISVTMIGGDWGQAGHA